MTQDGSESTDPAAANLGGQEATTEAVIFSSGLAAATLSDETASHCYVCEDWEVVVSFNRGGSPRRRVATPGLIGLCAVCLRLCHEERTVELSIRFLSSQGWDFRQSDLVRMLLDISLELAQVAPAPERADPRTAGRLPIGFDEDAPHEIPYF